MSVEIDDGSWLVASEDCVARDIAGETVILNLRNGTYYGIDDTGTHVWDLLQSGIALSSLLSELEMKFDVPRDRLSADVKDFLGDLAAHQLLDIKDQGTSTL